jgi:hypothetical protein
MGEYLYQSLDLPPRVEVKSCQDLIVSKRVMSVNAACEWWQACLSKIAGIAFVKMHLLFTYYCAAFLKKKSIIPFFYQ